MNDEQAEKLYFRADYILWVPPEVGEDSGAVTETDAAGGRLPRPYPRSDLLTLIQYKGNWRISDVRRINVR
uniref:Uncharacterized protein n=1 Tax=uncultured bacterium contig00061 TaxID=1181544 RepID=A0A806KH19_9BACT|nr:hypothetical protein [uncultured bacterium contig00061]